MNPLRRRFGGRIRSSILATSFLVALFSAAPASAGPYVVDGAGIGDVGDCEISERRTHAEGGLSSTALAAACVVLPGLELGATGFRVNENGGVPAAEPKANFGLIDDAEHGVGGALVAGAAFGFDPGTGSLPLSCSPVDALRTWLVAGDTRRSAAMPAARRATPARS